MGTKEDKVREAINVKYGSIKKMAEVTGIPRNTIYHALDRGLDNTTIRTRSRIEHALIDISIDDNEKPNDGLSINERELLTLYRNMDEKHQSLLLENARAFSALSEKDTCGAGADVERAGIAVM